MGNYPKGMKRSYRARIEVNINIKSAVYLLPQYNLMLMLNITIAFMLTFIRCLRIHTGRVVRMDKPSTIIDG